MMHGPCPQCGERAVVGYSSTDEKQCWNCYVVFPWPLDAGQVPLAANNRLKKPTPKEEPIMESPEPKGFYSPCVCEKEGGKFVPRQLLAEVWDPTLRKYVLRPSVTVCWNCGRMPPRVA